VGPVEKTEKEKATFRRLQGARVDFEIVLDSSGTKESEEISTNKKGWKGKK